MISACIPAETCAAQPEEPQRHRTPDADRCAAEQREDELGERGGGESQDRRDLRTDATRRDEHQPLAELGKLVRELGGDATAKGVTDDSDSVDLEHVEQIAHAVGEGTDGVVGAGLGGHAMAEQVGGDHRVVLGQRWNQRQPALGIVADAVEEQDGRTRAGHAVGAAVPVDRTEAERQLFVVDADRQRR